MEIKIRILLLLLVFSLHSFCQNSNYIEIKHTGSSDKPIWTILISTQNIELQDNALLQNTILDDVSFSQIKKFMSAYDYSVNKKILHPDDYGTFTITIGKANKKPVIFNTYHLLTIEKSRAFFKNIISFCKAHRFSTEIISQLQTTAYRIRPF